MTNTRNKVRTGIATAAIGLAALGVMPQTALADNSALPTKAKENIIRNIYADAGYYSMYLGTFGFSNSKGGVNQSDFGLDVGPVSYNLWENYDFEKEKVTEIDHTFSHTFSTKHLDTRLEFIYFDYPQNRDANDYDFDLQFKTKGYPLDARVEFNQCYGKGANDGRLVQFGLGKDIKLGKRIDLALEARATYNQRFFTSENDFSQFAASLKANINLGKGFIMTPSITTQKAINNMGGTFKTHPFVYGVNLSKSFW